MTNKFCFYFPAPSVDAETRKEVQKLAEVDGDTFDDDESSSASTSEDGGSAAAVHGAPQSKSDEVTEEASFDGEVAAGDESPPGVKQAISKAKEAAGGSEAKMEEKRKGLADDDNKQKSDAEATHESNDITQINGTVSEVTREHEECAPPLATSSTSSAAFGACNDQEVLKASDGEFVVPPGLSTVSGGFASMMSKRIQALDEIRGLLKNECAQMNSIRAEVAAEARVLEDELNSKHGSLCDLKAKNAGYANQSGHMSLMIEELVNTSQCNTTQIAILEQDVASKMDTIKEMKTDVKGQYSMLEQKIYENGALLSQLQTFKAQNKDLKLTVEDLETKNTEYGNEIENLTSSVPGLVEHNTALEGQVEELTDANDKLEALLVSARQKNAELLGTADSLTASKKEAEELQKENEAARQNMKEEQAREQDANALAIQQLEKIVESTKAEMKKRLAVQKDTFDKQAVGLTDALEEARRSIEEKSERSETLQKEIENIDRSAAEAVESTATTIGQLEKDLEEEFQITAKLNRSMENLKNKAQKDQDENFADSMEDLLSSLHMIQSLNRKAHAYTTSP